MDVQALDLSIGFPGRPRTRPAQPLTHRADDPPPGGRPAPGAVVVRRSWLHAYTAVSIVAGLGALLWTTMFVPILPGIDPGLDGTALAGPDGGMLLWIAFGLIGSLRVLPVPGSSAVWTFHFPFIAAAMVLGGPTAGAWVGFLSTIERRELETQPWYGALANHSVMAFAAVVGGLTVQVATGMLTAAGFDTALAGLVSTALGTLLLAALANAIAAGTVVLRQNLSPASLVEVLVRALGRMTMAEIGLAWVFTVAYLAAGWWAPLVIAAAVLVVWPSEIDGVDPLTGLQRLPAFQRSLGGMIERSRRGIGTGGALLSIDLDKFGRINKDLGFAIGNEAIAEVGRRLRAQMRATDIAARTGGDEFVGFFPGAFDAETAVRLATRIETAIRRPIVTSTGIVEVGASIGGLIVTPGDDAPDVDALMHAADTTMQKQKRTGGGVRLVERPIELDHTG